MDLPICGHLELYSATWPASGSMRNGRSYALPKSAPATSANASSSSPGALLPTPTTKEHTGPGRPDGPRNDTLRARIANLPTPRARDWKTGGKDGLHEKVRLLKTPTAQLAVNGGSQHPDKRRAGGHGPTLADEVEFLPLSVAKRAHPAVISRGATTRALYAAGNTSSDALPPGRTTSEAV